MRKQIQVLLQFLAIATASAGVAGNQLVDPGTKYYRSSLPGPYCDVALGNAENRCDEGTTNQCSVHVGFSTYYVSKIVNDGPCTSYFKD